MKNNKDMIRKIALVGILTALAAILSFIKIPIFSQVTITLVLPVVVIGGALCGPIVGAWLTVIPAIVAIPEATLFVQYSPAGGIATMILKGLLAGFLSALAYKLLSKKHPTGAVFCSAIVAPIVNTGVFFLGCFIFIFDKLTVLANEAGVGMGALLVGLGGINFVIELILNIILCPSILRIIQIAKKKFVK